MVLLPKTFQKVRILQGWLVDKLLDLFGKFDGMAIGNTILIRSKKLKMELLAHELVHVEQYHRLGFFKFLYNYMKSHYKYGYKDNPFEIEAYLKQEDFFYKKIAAKIMLKHAKKP